MVERRQQKDEKIEKGKTAARNRVTAEKNGVIRSVGREAGVSELQPSLVNLQCY